MVTTLGHILFAYGESFFRDLLRLKHWHTFLTPTPRRRCFVWTGFSDRRELIAGLMGFDQGFFELLDLITNDGKRKAELGYAISTF
jgi:hypothetical protein